MLYKISDTCSKNSLSNTNRKYHSPIESTVKINKQKQKIITKIILSVKI